jgi:hypothetical protein
MPIVVGPDSVVAVTIPSLPTISVTPPDATTNVRLVSPVLPKVIPPEQPSILVALVPGPPGPSGGSGFVWVQDTPMAQWSVTHPLGRYPLSTLVVIDGSEVVADIAFPSTTQVVVTFASPTSGTLTLI